MYKRQTSFTIPACTPNAITV